ncbi:hypothetical protein K3U93_03700 [Mycobacterium malmoense]|uniref:Mce protein n=1 Tax=Mycobacterium malmoense TaxID=1780 RepID=A0ABX3SZ32_MYCMA|nr:hypothetical protein [Mycobacterium malmoense]ORA85012.1 hypothetical protein BST29_02085 [Mycobacterium malmoense]QZA18329.1 hypothetical protein K3U93_03700 [Mycobacterium malmoense]UNB95099.1 hypothetical protein H5T25_03695 [Mycobacterium malmoense]
MPPRKLPSDPIGADNPRAGVLSASPSASVAGADELAQAEARAEAARARAIRLRQQAEAASSDQGNRSDADADAVHESAPSRRRLRRPGRKALAAAAAAVVICASLTASGYLVWHHRNVVAERQRAAEFSAAARNAVVTMMSIDPNKAREDMQRFADDTTGIFKVGFLMGAEDLVKAIEQSKISAKATVQAVAVQSMTKDSALVLVAAKSEIIKPGEAKPDSRSLRAVVAIQRDAGQLKVSRIEFVP